MNEPIRLAIGPVLHADDAVANKVCALFGRVSKLFGRLPDGTWVCPGHGGDTTLGAERPHLAEWRERGW